jgi:hypothetical protein
MTSSKKEKKEFEYKLRRAKELAALGVNPRHHDGEPPQGAVLADHEKLGHINTYGMLPRFYVDLAFICCNCSREEVWTAEQQKWYYEEVKGHIDSKAVRCRECRDAEKTRKDEARRIHLDGLEKKHKNRKA